MSERLNDVYDAATRSLRTTSGGAAGGTVPTTNPTRISAVYKATPATRTDGQTADIVTDANENLKVVEQQAPAYEMNTISKANVEHQYTPTAVLAADTQVKATAGFLHTVTISCNDAAPTAGSIIIFDSAAESGTQRFNHTFTTTPFVPFTVTLDYVMGTGIYVGFTTTADVNVSLSYR